MLRLAERVEDRARAIRTARRSVHRPDLQHDFGVHARHLGDHLGGVARVVALENIKDAARVRKRHVALENLEIRGLELRGAGLVHPGVGAAFGRVPLGDVLVVVAPGFVGVALRFRIPAREEAGRRVKLEVIAQQAGGVRVVEHVLMLPEVVLEDVVDEPAVEGNVGARTDAPVDVGVGGGSVVARVDHDPRCAAVLRAFDPAGRKRMVFDVVRADRENHVRILEVAPVRRHRAAAEGGREAGDGRGVADARLIVDGDDAERAGEFLNEPAFFIVELRGAKGGNAVAAVDGDAVLRLDEGGVARLLDALGNGVDRFVPGNLLPGLAARPAHERREHAVGVELRLALGRHDVAQPPHGSALGAEAADVDRMIGVAFEVDEFAVARRADRAAAAGAVAADVRRFLHVGELVDGLCAGRAGRPCALRCGGGERRRAHQNSALEETSARNFHESS